MNRPIELTIEQQFSLRSFESQVEQMSHSQSKQFLVELYEHLLVKEALYKEMLKHQWNIETLSLDELG